MYRSLNTLAALSVVTMAAMPAPSMADTVNRTKVGTLTCDIAAGVGQIIASRKAVACLFSTSQHGPQEAYSGEITKFGIDLGATSAGQLVWAIYAPTNNKRIGALAGSYGGASAEATIGAGVGANVLVGGSDRTVTLQPVSVQGQTGLNVAAGVSGLELRPAKWLRASGRRARRHHG